MEDWDVLYPCIGVCITDPESGICQGCGRPPEPVKTVEPVAVTALDKITIIKQPAAKPADGELD